MKVHPVIYHLFKLFIRLALVILFIGIPVATWYLRNVGIDFGAREALSQALSNNAMDVTIGRLALDPFRGLIAEEVSVSDKSPSHHTLARLSSLVVSLNLSELLQRRIVVDRISLQRASASIPLLKSDDSVRLTASDIDAEIFLLGDKLRFSLLDGKIAGIRIQFNGEILNPLALQVTHSENSQHLDETFLQSLTKIFSDISFPDGSPTLKANFDYDASDPQSLQIGGIQFVANKTSFRNAHVDSIAIHADYANGNLSIPHILIRDKSGQLQASGNWNKPAAEAQLSVISSLNPSTFINAFVSKESPLRKLQLPSPPRFEADFSVDLKSKIPQFKATGQLSAPEFRFDSMKFTNAGLGFSYGNGIFYARDIALSASRGQLTGNLWMASDDIRLTLKNSIPPPDLAPLFDAPAQEFLRNMQFKDLPEVRVSLNTKKLDFPSIRGTGHVKLGRTAMRGSWVDSGDADFDIADRCFTYKNIVIAMGAGRGTGLFAYDIAKQEVRFENIRSTLIPCDLMMWIDPRIAKTLTPYRFRSGPLVTLQGKVGMRGPEKNALSINVESAAGLDYDLLGKTLSFGRTTGHVDVTANKVHVNIKKAELLGGNVALDTLVSINPKDPTFSTDVTLNRVDFAKLTTLYFKYDDSKGFISGRYKFNARMGEESLMTGTGNIRIEDGNVFAIPLFGPFSYILGSILPGVVYNTARLATADFTAANQKITTKNIEIQGRGFSMFGQGDIFFLTGGLDMSMRINAQGIPGIVFFPVSKLFEYYSNGTISEPHWSPKIIPRIPIFGGSQNKNTTP